MQSGKNCHYVYETLCDKICHEFKISCFKFLGFWTCDFTEYTIKRVIDWDIHPN